MLSHWRRQPVITVLLHTEDPNSDEVTEKRPIQQRRSLSYFTYTTFRYLAKYLPNIYFGGDLIFTIFLINSNETNIIVGKQRSSHTLLLEPLIVCVGYARAESYLQELTQSLLIIATTLPWLHSQPHDMMR